jgi:hypothetical protein
LPPWVVVVVRTGVVGADVGAAVARAGAGAGAGVEEAPGADVAGAAVPA